MGFKDIGVEMKDHPKTSVVVLSTLAATVFACRSNPSAQDFRDQHLDYKLRLLYLDESKRNDYSNEYIERIERCFNYGIVRRTSFGLFSVMWIDNFDKGNDFYEARCKFLKVGWLELSDRLIDVGFNRKWYWLEKAMDRCDNKSSVSEGSFPPGLLCERAT